MPVVSRGVSMGSAQPGQPSVLRYLDGMADATISTLIRSGSSQKSA
jgi:hypothetical protein